jgi:hypothetical protein
MKSGDKYKTNRMFRRRIYAQGFTILAMVAGSAYWEGDRIKRKQFDGIVEEKKKKEQHEAWLKELEIREEEEQELRAVRKKLMEGRRVDKQKVAEEERRTAEAASESESRLGDLGPASSEGDQKKSGSIISAVKDIWPGKK